MDSNPTPKRRRARKPDGSFKGDNPTTPNLNEAWEPTPIERVITDKSVDYSVKQQVSGPSASTAGKYSKKETVRPTFGKVTTTFN
jgi:hypothetical protein